MNTKQRIFNLALVGLSLCLSPNISLAADTLPVNNFAALRNEVLGMIGGASRRIWLTTDFLTDGEIVSALYVAQYRKVHVLVLLGRSRANHFMSRLGYLKEQKITVFLRPPRFTPESPTLLLADDTLTMIDGELDSQVKFRKFNLRRSTDAERTTYEKSFVDATALGIPATPTQSLPLVGRGPRGHRPGYGSAYNPDAQKGRLPVMNSRISPAEAEGSYRYDARREPRPRGVPDRLPKVPLWQERARERERGHEKTPGDQAAETIQ